MIHLEGRLYDNDGVAQIESGISLPAMIEEKLFEYKSICHLIENSRYGLDNEVCEDCEEVSFCLPNVSFQIFVSDKECSLEDVKEKQILSSIGVLDMYQEWYGYSEFTIMGYDILNFELVGNGGRHDLYNIFNNNIGKYVHILIDVLDENNQSIL